MEKNRFSPLHDAAARARRALERPNKRRRAKELVAKARRTRARIRALVACSIVLGATAYVLE